MYILVFGGLKRPIESSILVPALIALAGTVIAALLSAGFIGDLLLNPAVYIEVKNDGSTSPTMLITNDGSELANNLHLFIESSPAIIQSVKNVDSTTDISLLKPPSGALQIGTPIPVSTNLLEILIPKLATGVGSKVQIETLLNEPAVQDEYDVSISYDEGSAIGSSNPSIVRSISSWFSSLSTLYFISIIGYSALSMFTGLYILLRRRKRRVNRVKSIIRNIENLYRELVDDPNSAQQFDTLYKTEGEKMSGTTPTSQGSEDRHSMVRDILYPKDYVIIDDLYAKIKERDQNLNKTLPAASKAALMTTLNTQLLALLRKASNIEWNNYL